MKKILLTTRSLIIITVFLLISCGGGDDTTSTPPEDGYGGPCIHTVREPVLSIQTATTIETGDAVSQIVLKNIKFNGTDANINHLIIDSFNITTVDNSLMCNVPCGFGNEEGTYEFTINAANHTPINFMIDALYSVFVGGCPSYNDVGTNVDISLNVL